MSGPKAEKQFLNKSSNRFFMPYNQYTNRDVTVHEEYIETSDAVSLKLIDFIPEADSPEKPIVVFVAGWISLISGWGNVLKQLTSRYRTLYLETREKKSARLPANMTVDFSVGRMSKDIKELLQQKVPPERPFCFAGSSLGSTTILDYLSQNSRQSFNAFLIAPNCEFSFPLWFLLALRFLPAAFYTVIKPVVKWYLREIRLDKNKEPEQVRKYEGTLDAAEPKRLKASAWALKDYSLWHKLSKVKTPVLIIGAESDLLHGVKEMEKMVALMPFARLKIMASNKETHSKKAGEFIARQISIEKE